MFWAHDTGQVHTVAPEHRRSWRPDFWHMGATRITVIFMVFAWGRYGTNGGNGYTCSTRRESDIGHACWSFWSYVGVTANGVRVRKCSVT